MPKNAVPPPPPLATDVPVWVEETLEKDDEEGGPEDATAALLPGGPTEEESLLGGSAPLEVRPEGVVVASLASHTLLAKLFPTASNICSSKFGIQKERQFEWSDSNMMGSRIKI